jgi:hypothetical protein
MLVRALLSAGLDTIVAAIGSVDEGAKRVVRIRPGSVITSAPT